MVGGGHTVAAVQELGLSDKMSYISTAGGALIEFLMRSKLPAVAALEEAAKKREAYRAPFYSFISILFGSGLLN